MLLRAEGTQRGREEAPGWGLYSEPRMLSQPMAREADCFDDDDAQKR
eukprot:COSAG01_NODE_46616_length_398_cov_1.387960_1_plen_46_part_10